MLFSRLVNSILLIRVANALGNVTMSTKRSCTTGNLRYLAQVEAAKLDEELFTDYKFSVDQLMELAGLSVATAIAKEYPPKLYYKVLIVCGPGNNGGDGLVAARHLRLFGYNVHIYYPKRTPKPLYENLLEQAQKFGVSVINELPADLVNLRSCYNILVDALFGFSFKPPVRKELVPAMEALMHCGVPVISVDVPSGWDVEKGPITKEYLQPAMLISLSAPKMCAKPHILGEAKHYLGGRFLPEDIVNKYRLHNLPPYPDQDQVVQLSC